jgi:hypothetical protein
VNAFYVRKSDFNEIRITQSNQLLYEDDRNLIYQCDFDRDTCGLRYDQQGGASSNVLDKIEVTQFRSIKYFVTDVTSISLIF